MKASAGNFPKILSGEPLGTNSLVLYFINYLPVLVVCQTVSFVLLDPDEPQRLLSFKLRLVGKFRICDKGKEQDVKIWG